MSTFSKTPIYNLSAVLRETGLKADLIRAWERRYGLPRPERSEGGHRLYSQFDIETLNWLKDRQAEGLSISQAAQLWKSLAQEGGDPLGSIEVMGYKVSNMGPEPGETIAELRQSWITACTNFDSAESENVFNQAFATHPVEMVVTEILQKGIREIGKGWYDGRVSVQQEHFASSIAERRLQTLLSLTPLPTRPQSVLIGCPSGEVHVLPVMMIDLFLRRKGYKVIYLGADIPIDQMVATTIRVRPDLIILSAQTIRAAASLMETFSALQSSGKTLAYGGLIFNRVPALRERIPAHFLGEDLDAATDYAIALLSGNRPEPIGHTKSTPHGELSMLFQEKRAAIEVFVQQRMLEKDPQMKFIPEANFYFSGDLLAALKLGDPAYLETDLDWVQLLLTGRNIHGIQMKDYLKAYRDGIEEHIGTEGERITSWLDSITT